jgi:hypothetical protein
MYGQTLKVIKFITGAATAASSIPLLLDFDTPLLSKIEQWAVYGHLILLGLSLAGSAVVLCHVAHCAYRNRARIRAYWMRLMREYETGRR